MDANRSRFCALVALTLAVGLSAGVAPGQVQISGNTYDGNGGPLLGGNTYQVTGDLVVPAGQTLTVQGGAVIKLWGGHVYVNGTLNVTGSVANPAVFTSWNDGTVGLPVGTGAPAPSQWRRIHFTQNADGSVLVGAVVRFAGAYSAGALICDQADITLTDCTITDNGSPGLYGSNNSFPTVSGCTFANCVGDAVTTFAVGALPGFSGNFAYGNTTGDFIRITLGTFTGNLVIGPDCGMNGNGVVVIDNDLVVAAGQTLTVAAGTIMKWPGFQHLYVYGTLLSQGTSAAPVILTCFADDTAGGDTNKNGGATLPQPSSWRRVHFGPASDASTLDHTEVRYAGAYSSGGVVLDQADITLTHCTVSNSGAHGLYGGNNSFPTVTDCTFADCSQDAVYAFSAGALPGFSGNFASGNGTGDFIRITLGTFSGNLAIGPQSGMNGNGVVVIQGDLVIGAGQTLTIAPGTIIKWSGLNHLYVNGTLLSQGSASAPVILTAFADDSAGGDTDKNGAATLPQPSSWRRVQFGVASDASTLDYTEIRYAGAYSAGAIDLDQADITLNHCTFKSAGCTGLYGRNNSKPTVTACDFQSGLDYAASSFALEAVPGFTDNTASGNLHDYLAVTSTAFGTFLTIGPRAGMNGSGVIVLATDVVVSGGQTLSLLPGTILKWQVQGTLTVAGTMSAFGTGFDPVVMTSIHDDTFGGDTNGNGSATLPAPSHWRRVDYVAGSSGLVRGLRVRYAGAYSTAGFQCASPLVSLRALRVDFCGSQGMWLSALAGDALDCVVFGCSSHGVDLSAGSMGFIHGTVAGNGGQGIVSATAHTGIAVNTISWGNGGANFSGFTPAELAHCDGDVAAAGSNGNINSDPLFADPILGDVTLLSGSPALNAGNVAVGNALITDCEDASRRLDHDLSGNDAPDMGAYELGAWTMTVSGEPRLGTTITFNCLGPSGTAIYAMGFLDGPEVLLSPFGFLTLGDPTNLILLTTSPANAPLSFQLPPPAPVWQGAPFAIQALVLPYVGATVGNLTARYADLLFY